MASQNAEIAEALAFFRAKKCAYASPMDVARALREGSTAVHIVDVRNPVAPIPTIIKGAVWIPGREIARRPDELPGDRTIVLVCWDVWCSLATSAAIPLLENGFVAKELNGGIKAWQTLTVMISDVGLSARLFLRGARSNVLVCAHQTRGSRAAPLPPRDRCPRYRSPTV